MKVTIEETQAVVKQLLAKMSATELARDLGKSYPCIMDWSRGKRNCDLANLEKMQGMLKIANRKDTTK